MTLAGQIWAPLGRGEPVQVASAQAGKAVQMDSLVEGRGLHQMALVDSEFPTTVRREA